MKKTPATFGGSGFKLRTHAHQQDIEQGVFWRRCGVNNEWGPLKEVLLFQPPDSISIDGSPDDFLMLEHPDLVLMKQQTVEVKSVLESFGVAVQLCLAPAAPPITIFARDLFFMTPEGAVVGRPASIVRAGEPAVCAKHLSILSVPILATITGNGTFEGADALWVNSKQVIVGVGNRTNLEGARQLAHILRPLGVDVTEVTLHKRTQHLLGALVVLDQNLAAVDRTRCTKSLLAALTSHNMSVIELDESSELREGRGMNFVAVGPRQIVMPANCTNIANVMEDHGVTVATVDVSEAIKAGGALGCIIGILNRS